MERFVGLLGLGTMLGLAYLFSTERKAIRLKTVLWGLGLQISFAFFVLRFDIGRRIFQAAGDAVNRLLSLCWLGIRVRGNRQESLVVRVFLRLSSAAHDYFHCRVFCGAVSHRRDATHYSRRGVGDDARDGGERGGIAECRGEHFHGANGSSAHHPALPQ